MLRKQFLDYDKKIVSEEMKGIAQQQRQLKNK